MTKGKTFIFNCQRPRVGGGLHMCGDIVKSYVLNTVEVSLRWLTRSCILGQRLQVLHARRPWYVTQTISWSLEYQMGFSENNPSLFSFSFAERKLGDRVDSPLSPPSPSNNCFPPFFLSHPEYLSFSACGKLLFTFENQEWLLTKTAWKSLQAGGV